MSRLIDADKLLSTIQEQEMWNVPDFVYESIQNAPTVEAVTYEFIEEYIGYIDPEEKEALRNMLRVWELVEEEHEKD